VTIDVSAIRLAYAFSCCCCKILFILDLRYSMVVVLHVYSTVKIKVWYHYFKITIMQKVYKPSPNRPSQLYIYIA